MHDAEYTKRIKALLAAREELTLNLNSAVYQFRNGRKPYAENVEQAKQAFREVLEILEPLPGEEGKDSKREAAIARAQQEDRKCTHGIWPERSLEENVTEFKCADCGEVVQYW